MQCIAGLTDTPGLDAQVLLAHVCHKNREWVLAHPEYRLTFNETLSLADDLVQLAAGIPLPYVIGEWEFYGLKFHLTPTHWDLMLNWSLPAVLWPALWLRRWAEFQWGRKVL